jgi:hypothetical protein
MEQSRFDLGAAAVREDVASHYSRKTPKRPEDTPGGCRAYARANLAEAARVSTRNGRLRLETSAASWAMRADLLDRLDRGFAEKLASGSRALEAKAKAVSHG